MANKTNLSRVRKNIYSITTTNGFYTTVYFSSLNYWMLYSVDGKPLGHHASRFAAADAALVLSAKVSREEA